MATLLITGGAGFIGSNFVHHALAETSDRLVVVDKLTYAGSLLNLEGALQNPRMTFVRADIADATAMAWVFKDVRPDAVLNLAAETHVDRSIDSPRAFVDTNIVGTCTLLEAARKHVAALTPSGREQFRFLHVSTDEVYGTLGATGTFSEETPYAPNSPYAASKAAADHIVRSYFHTYSLPTLITNCSNNYGPYQFPEKLVPLMILNALDRRPLPIYGDGGNVRDWLHVADHCAGLLLVLREGRPGGKYNIGGDAERDQPRDRRPHLRRARRGRARKRESPLAQDLRARPSGPRSAIRDRRDEDPPGARVGAGAHPGARPSRYGEWYVTHRDWCAAVQAGRYDRERLGLGER